MGIRSFDSNEELSPPYPGKRSFSGSLGFNTFAVGVGAGGAAAAPGAALGIFGFDIHMDHLQKKKKARAPCSALEPSKDEEEN
tara:strand:- start:277 stop:525 length:249 start_codon:yes stop_codon:yes gene_type:complete